MQFEKNILALYGNRGKAWLEDLPNQVQKLAAEWDLSDLKPMDNLTYNYVLSGLRNDTPIILKLNPNDLNLQREADALNAFAGYGAIALLESQKNALLLQRALPGLTVKKHPEAIAIACKTIEKLHQAPLPEEGDFPHIEDVLSDLDTDWDIPKKLLEKARTLKDELLQTATPCILLHADLHQDNILSHENEWLVIDPKGVIGFPINEVWACVENPDYDLTYIANYFHYPLNEVVQWYFVHLVLAACWQVEDYLDPSKFLTLAETVLKQNDGL